jgi:hypothetical protein
MPAPFCVKEPVPIEIASSITKIPAPINVRLVFVPEIVLLDPVILNKPEYVFIVVAEPKVIEPW